MKKTRVLIVDDSALMREVLREIISRDASLEVVGVAADPYAAWARIKASKPDVVTLDVEMPRMDGITFLERLMAVRPLPVIMISSAMGSGREATVRALELGAVDFVTKPDRGSHSGIEEVADEVVGKVKIASRSRVRSRASRRITPLPGGVDARGICHPNAGAVIAVGASTGGPEVLSRLLSAMPEDSPGIVLVQHMPAGFTTAFARRLDSLCRIDVREAEPGDVVSPGLALLAPGDFHTSLQPGDGQVVVDVFRGEPVNRHRPSVDVLFHSCASVLADRGVGVILTGMGADGARGLLAMRRSGALTIAQDESSSVVFGMPREACRVGAVERVLPPESMAAALISSRPGRAPRSPIPV